MKIKPYLIAPEVRYVACNHPKYLLFFNQSDKSPDSGLQADDV